MSQVAVQTEVEAEQNPLPSALMYEEATKWGFQPATATALSNLYAYMMGEDISPVELKRWQDLNIITADGKVMLENDGVDVMEWTLMGLTWEGLIQRVNVVTKDAKADETT